MLKLFRNTLYFKNVTIKFSDSGNLCNTCKSEREDRIHFFKCEKHAEFIDTLFFGFIEQKFLKKMPNLQPYFFNITLPPNHPTNLIFISTMKCIYNLRYFEIVPTWKIIRNHLSKFISSANLMYPDDKIWNKCSNIPLYFCD